jgi:exopolysaccharide production protein ExoQ
MAPALATFIVVVGILGLFWLDRDPKVRTSAALWIPIVWLAIAGSRPVAQWLGAFGIGGSSRYTTVEQVLEGSPIDRAVYTGLLAIGIVVLLGRTTRVWEILRANKLILFCLFYFAVSLLWSEYPGVAFKRWTKAVGDLVMILVILTDREPLMAIKRLLSRLSFVLIPVSILFIKYYPQLGMGYSAWTGGAIYMGVTTNKNTLGVVCLCFGLGALWRFLAASKGLEVTGRTRHLIAHGVILAMVMYLFRLMDSMTSFSSFLMALVLVLATSYRPVIRRPAVVHILVASMLAVSGSVAFLGVSPSALQAMGRNPTLTERTDLWATLLSVVRDPWFGTGFESFWLGSRLDEIWRRSSFQANEAHNGYLEVFLNLGWVGIALLAAVIVVAYPRVFAAWRKNDPRGVFCLTYFFVGLVYNFTEAAFFQIQSLAWPFFLLAIVKTPLASTRATPTVTAAHDSTFWPLPWEQAQATFHEEAV